MANVLVVDDNEPIRRLAAKVLERDGHTVEEAADGNEAIALIDSNRYDAVVLDLMMPGSNGFHVIEALRERHPALLPRVVVMTAAISQVDSEALNGVGATLSKPFEIDTLVDSVSRCLQDGE